jgi:hypothetical protein
LVGITRLLGQGAKLGGVKVGAKRDRAAMATSGQVIATLNHTQAHSGKPS